MKVSWLTHADDEVTRFHPEFEAVANEALRRLNLGSELEWVHHVRTVGSSVIPDFVLRKRISGTWLLAFELKRRSEAVFSTRNQIQAKGYAEANQALYGVGTPKYFAISNLEVTILFALNGDRPPRECQLLDGSFGSGNFQIDSVADHQERFVEHLIEIINRVVSARPPRFDEVWPAVLRELFTFSEGLPPSIEVAIPEPETPNWSVVRDFFSSPLAVDSARVFFLRCLMVEYLRGLLLKFGHDRASQLPPLRANLSVIANAISAIRLVDFGVLFEEFAPGLYRSLADPNVVNPLIRYADALTTPGRRVVEFARDRVDAPTLIDSVIPSLYPGNLSDQGGKVQTDPELAAILARITIDRNVRTVLDPCCGDGSLLSAAYDFLSEFRGTGQEILAAVSGIEADTISVRLAQTRLGLKQPSTLEPNPPISLLRGDLFANAEMIGTADAVLMNPPFIRYEEQQGFAVPAELRAHYNEAISNLTGLAPVTTVGQPNLYSYYVEFVLNAARTGARLGIILDNKWYHNKYGVPLREFLLNNCEIEAILEYPHWAFFSDWTIATSILVIRKVDDIDPSHEIRFIRSVSDPRGVDLAALVAAFNTGCDWPIDWVCHTKPQHGLDSHASWKQFFSSQLKNDFRIISWPTLDDLFRSSRRGSLDKEGGGVAVYEFPFSRTNYGPERLPRADRTGWQTAKGRNLTQAENERLRTLAGQIPEDYRGWSLRNSDNLQGYRLTPDDVRRQETLEPPNLREHYEMFLAGRTDWTEHHEAALAQMRGEAHVAAYIDGIEDVVNLTEEVLPKELLWVVLREPIAGELIIPRKVRNGHRVHINPYAFSSDGRQIRISSNFVTYSGCIATDSSSGLTREIAVSLIAAFLVSSFGQLQCEIEGYNREGLLALEKHHLSKIKILDPRMIRVESRQPILDAFARLPYPISTTILSAEHPARNELDKLIAEEIVFAHPQFSLEPLLTEVHASLDEWLIARQP